MKDRTSPYFLLSQNTHVSAIRFMQFVRITRSPKYQSGPGSRELRLDPSILSFCHFPTPDICHPTEAYFHVMIFPVDLW